MYVLGIVLAGGRGERLYPLTAHEPSPPCRSEAGTRIVDFVLSNFVNSGILSIYVLTQFKAQSLLEHLEKGWRTTDFWGITLSRRFLPKCAWARIGIRAPPTLFIRTCT